MLIKCFLFIYFLANKFLLSLLKLCNFNNKFCQSFLTRKTTSNEIKKVQKLATCIWYHGASAGELIDLIPIIESISSPTIVTASSISATKTLKKLSLLDHVKFSGIIPNENKNDILHFLSVFNPSKFILSQRDSWPGLYYYANKHIKEFYWLPQINKPLPLIIKQTIGNKLHKCFVSFDDKSNINLPESKIVKVTNPRFYSTIERVNHQKTKPHVLNNHEKIFCQQKINVIIGSAHVKDVELICKLKNINLTIIPHEYKDLKTLDEIKQLAPNANLIAKGGILVEAYQGFDVAFIGGGFTTGVHNLIEPALWDLPIICGPKTHTQSIANDFLQNKQLKIINTKNELNSYFKSFTKNKIQFKKLMVKNDLQKFKAEITNYKNT